MKKIIHVNQHNIKHNRKHNDNKAVLTVKTYKSNEYAHEVIIVKNGQSIGKVVYCKQGLSCGANVWIEFDTNIVDIVTIDNNNTYTVEEKCKIAEAEASYRYKGERFDDDGCNLPKFQTIFNTYYDNLD